MALKKIDPEYKLDNLKSMELEGLSINEDTLRISFFKMLPDNFKSISFNSSDSIVSIVNESYYFQHRNSTSSKSPRSSMDVDIFQDPFKFDIFYAINQSIDLAKVRIIEETSDFIKIGFKQNVEYVINIDKNNQLITQYSCDCLKLNNQNLIVYLKEYKPFEGIHFPTQTEFWVENERLIEKFIYYDIKLNNLSSQDFKLIED